MKVTYFEKDDTLVIRFCEKPVVRESSRDWHTHISYSAEGEMVEIVVLEAKKHVSDPKNLEFVIAAA
jgi:uncharacterized protein YuzE